MQIKKHTLIALSLIILIGTANAATYYVSLTGSGVHNGSQGNEFTLNEAIAFADQHLDEEITFLLSNGSYSLSYTNNWKYNIPNRTAWVTFKPKTGNSPVFTKISIDNYSNDIESDVNVMFRFEDLRIESNDSESGCWYGVIVNAWRGANVLEFINVDIVGTGNNAGIILGVDFAKISNSRISHMGECTAIQSNGNNFILENSVAFDALHGASVGGEDILISGNEFYQIYSDGLLVGGHRILVENNEFHDLYSLPDSGAHTDLIQVGYGSGTTDLTIRGNIGYNTEGQMTWLNVGNGKNFTIENNLFYKPQGSIDTEHGSPFQIGGVENLLFKNNTIIGKFTPGNVFGDVRFLNNLISMVAWDISNVEVVEESNNIVSRMGYGMYEEYSPDAFFDWSNSSILLTDFSGRWNYYNPEFYSIFVNVPEFCDVVAKDSEPVYNVVLGEDAEGHVTLTSQDFDFENHYVFPYYTIKVTRGAENLDCRFQDPTCQMMPVYKVEGNTIVIRSDNKVVNPGALLDIEVMFSTSTKTKVYYVKNAEKYGQFEVGDTINYQMEVEDGLSHVITAVGQDSYGKYFELATPLKEKARANRYVCNWKSNLDTVWDFSPLTASIACPGGNPNLSSGEYIGALKCIPCQDGQKRPCNLSGEQGVCIQGEITCSKGVFGSCLKQSPLPNYDGKTEIRCSDNLDNDCDGLTDCDDLDCDCPDYFRGLVSWWRFNGNTDDYYGENYGVFSDNELRGDGTDTRLNGIIDNVLVLDGFEDYVVVNDDISLRMNEVLTISALIKPATLTPSNDMYIVSKTTRTPDGDNYRFFVGGGNKAAKGNLAFGYYGDGISSFWQNIDSGYSLPDTGWHHVAVVFNFENKTLDFYDNGLIVSQKTINVPLESGTNGNLYIGVESTAYGTVGSFNGSIDEVMVYNKTLNSGEIFDLFESSKPQCVDNSVLTDYINQWKQGILNMITLMQKIENWKRGEGC